MSRPVVVLGEFDGFHLGHRQLVHAAMQVADRHSVPLFAIVMNDLARTDRLGTSDEICRALLGAGAAVVHMVDVDARNGDEVAAQIVHELAGRLDPAAVVMACLPGESGSARFPSLRHSLRAAEMAQIEVERWTDVDGTPITSFGVRAALAEGDVVRAASWLGRPYTLSGLVVHGSALGRTIGFPTANLLPPPARVIPACGVYAATVTTADGREHMAAVNIGARPTVEVDGQLLIEAHLLDFDEDIYDTTIRIGFSRWLRGERRFESIDELTTQLDQDVTRARIAAR